MYEYLDPGQNFFCFLRVQFSYFLSFDDSSNNNKKVISDNFH